MFKIKSEKTSLVEDTDPILYAKRCERELKQSNYQQAIVEIDKAIKYSKTTTQKIGYIKTKVDIIYGTSNEVEIFNYLNSQLPIFMDNIGLKEVIELVCKNIKNEECKRNLFKEIISYKPYNYTVLVHISNIKNLKDKTFIYDYINCNLNAFIKKSNISEILKNLKNINIDKEKKVLLLDSLLYNYTYNIEILNDMIYLGKESFVIDYIDSNLTSFLKEYGVNQFIKELKQMKIKDKCKRNYLHKILEMNIDRINVLDEIIYYYRNDIHAAIDYIDLLINFIYKDYSKMSLIYLRKGILIYQIGELRNSEDILKEALKMTKEEDIDGKDKGEILFNLSIVHCGLAKKSFKYINYQKARILYKRARKHGYHGDLPVDSDRDSSWSTSTLIMGIIMGIIVLIIIVRVSDKYNTIDGNMTDYNEDNENYQVISNYDENENNLNKEKQNYLNEDLYEFSDLCYNIYSNAYSDEQNAIEEMDKIREQGIEAKVVKEDEYYKVMLGNSDTVEDARSIKEKLSYTLNKELYILVFDEYVETNMNQAKSHIDYYEMEQAKELLDEIQNTVLNPGYEGYKKEYVELQSIIKQYDYSNEIEEDKPRIETLLQNVFYDYDTAVAYGNPEIMYQYVTYQGESYNDYKKNIPNFYDKGIVVNMIDYNIYDIKREENGNYRVHCLTNFEIINSEGSRHQTEEMDYVIKKESNTGQLLVDKIENWKVVE